ncbi:C39 family peptidase [Variovorax paradoxus]|nr:C39 family peptidase [Variovorax paradoxus]
MRGLLLFLALFATAGPAPGQLAHLPSMGAGDVIMPVVSMRQARLAGTLLQKFDFSCGSAAVATLLTHHYGYPVTEQVVFEEMYARGDKKKIHREGFSLLDMKRFLAAHGFEADGFEQPLDKLNEARIPAIVLINENGYHHFVVVKGVQADRVLIGDPAQGTRAMPRRTFEANWKNSLLFVIHNRMESARFNLAADWRVAPRAPLGGGVSREGLSHITMPKLGPGEF